MNNIFKALKDETLRKILTLLSKKGPLTASENNHLGISKPNISYHLNTLKNADLVIPQKR